MIEHVTLKRYRSRTLSSHQKDVSRRNRLCLQLDLYLFGDPQEMKKPRQEMSRHSKRRSSHFKFRAEGMPHVYYL